MRLTSSVPVSRKDMATRRRELIVSYLVDAYRKLEKSANAVTPEESWAGIASAIADIQLFGSSGQVELARGLFLLTAAPAKATIPFNHLRRGG